MNPPPPDALRRLISPLKPTLGTFGVFEQPRHPRVRRPRPGPAHDLAPRRLRPGHARRPPHRPARARHDLRPGPRPRRAAHPRGQRPRSAAPTLPRRPHRSRPTHALPRCPIPHHRRRHGRRPALRRSHPRRANPTARRRAHRQQLPTPPLAHQRQSSDTAIPSPSSPEAWARAACPCDSSARPTSPSTPCDDGASRDTPARPSNSSARGEPDLEAAASSPGVYATRSPTRGEDAAASGKYSTGDAVWTIH